MERCLIGMLVIGWTALAIGGGGFLLGEGAPFMLAMLLGALICAVACGAFMIRKAVEDAAGKIAPDASQAREMGVPPWGKPPQERWP